MERLESIVKSDMKELLFDEKTIKDRVKELGQVQHHHFGND